MQKKLTALVLFVVAACAMLMISTDVNAQRRRPRNRTVRYSRAALDNIIRRVEERADRFVRAFNDTLDRSRLEDTALENRLNQRARDLGDATDELRRDFDRRDSLAENRPEVRACLDIASDLDLTMRRRRFSATAESTWVTLRTELNALARAYGVPGVGRTYR